MKPKVSWESLPTVVLAWGDLCIPHSCDVPRRPSRRSGPQVTLRVAIRRRLVGSHILVRRLCFIVGHDWVRKRRAPTAPIGPLSQSPVNMFVVSSSSSSPVSSSELSSSSYTGSVSFIPPVFRYRGAGLFASSLSDS
jgi:hypothetical protein